MPPIVSVAMVDAPYYASEAPPPKLSREMPEDLKKAINELEIWASQNARDARNDAFAFWALKIPAMVTSAGAGMISYFDIPSISILLGTIASLCVIIDGVNPRGRLRNVHLRACHDLRMLTNKMNNQWRSRNHRSSNENASRKIIKDAGDEIEMIGKYIRDAESALKANPHIVATTS